MLCGMVIQFEWGISRTVPLGSRRKIDPLAGTLCFVNFEAIEKQILREEEGVVFIRSGLLAM